MQKADDLMTKNKPLDLDVDASPYIFENDQNLQEQNIIKVEVTK